MQIRTFISVSLLLEVLQMVHSSSIDTVYNYHNRTAYIHLQQDSILIPISFNNKYTNGDSITTTIESPSKYSKFITANNNLYAIYPDENNNTIISSYNDTKSSWSDLTLESEIEFYEYSAYLNTFDDPSSLYVYGGLNYSSDEASSRLLKVDLDSFSIEDVTTSIQPTAFYDSSSIMINYNTQLFIGGKASNGWVGMKQLALWQYESWGFKPAVFESNSASINSRINPLVLPIFDTGLNQDYASNNFTDFSVSSLFMIGGKSSDGSYSSPNFASLDMSSSAWSWESLDTNVSVANSKVNSNANCDLDMSLILGAAMIYDTLVVISNTTVAGVNNDNKNSKRSSDQYFLKLFNTTSLETIDSIDYTSFDTSSNKSKSNKSLIIVLSVIIPVLAVIILTIVFALLYKRHKRKKQDKESEKEMQDIMEFYQGANNHSASTLISSTISQKSPEKTNAVHHENTYFGNEVKVNDYDDGDNLSISSWRRKREEYAKEQRKHLPFIPALPMNRFPNQHTSGDVGDEIPKTSGSIVKRSLSSLRRNLSLQSSIRSFVTAKSTFHESEEDGLQQLVEPLSPPQNIYSSDTPKSNSSLYLIPEHESPSPHHMRSPKQESIMSSVSNTNTSSTNFSSETLTNKSINGSRCSHTRDSSLIFQNIKPNLSPPSKAATRFSPKLHHQQLPALNTNPFIVPDADDEDLNNLDVQVLVSSKRRSKLRIINPDEENPFEEIDMEKDMQQPYLQSSPLPKQPGTPSLQFSPIPKQPGTPSLQFSPIPKRKSMNENHDHQDDLFDTSLVDGSSSPQIQAGTRKRCVSDENKNKDESVYL